MKMLCKVTRGENIESQHIIYATAIDEGGKTVFNTAPKDYTTCARSSLKPFQASASILAGATEEFTSEEIALMCASHNGEKMHIDVAMGMAKKLGFNSSHYECGTHTPLDKESSKKILQSKIKLTPFYNNCSGKHSGMLALAKKLKKPPKNYVKITHPVQQTILNQLKRLTKQESFYYGTDGCSAPTPYLSLTTLAKLFQSLGSNKYPELSAAYHAMMKHPYLIGGNNRFDTDFGLAMKGRGICKAGGEAIRGLVIQTNRYGLLSISLKVVDGNHRALDVATTSILHHLEALTKKEKELLSQYIKKPIINHCEIQTGEIIAEILDNE